MRRGKPENRLSECEPDLFAWAAQQPVRVPEPMRRSPYEAEIARYQAERQRIAEELMAEWQELHGGGVEEGAMGELYDTDIVVWSEHQAALLHRIAAGELVNSADLDWPNIAEEIESVGREQVHAVESLLVQALLHMLKAEAWPLMRDAPNWRAEPVRFRGDALTGSPLDAASDRPREAVPPCAACNARDAGRPGTVASATGVPRNPG